MFINNDKIWQFCCDVHEYIHFVNTFDSLKYLYFYLTSLSVFRWSHSESNCFVVCLMKYESGQWLRLDLIWPRTIWSTRHTHNSSPSFPSFSLWHKNLPYPILCNHCPIMQWEMPPATTIYLCVENVTELWPHHKHIFLFRFFILSDETPWPSGSVDSPQYLSDSGKTNLLGLTWARQAFCWGSGTEPCQLITGWWILPPTAGLSARLPPSRPGTDGEVQKFWQLWPRWAKCKTEDELFILTTQDKGLAWMTFPFVI